MTPYENKTKKTYPIKVTMPSGKVSRVTLPVGKFELPHSYVRALTDHPYGAKLLKKFKIKTPKVKQDDTDIKADDKPEDA